MEDYTKTGGLKKLMKFKKRQIALKFIALLKKLKNSDSSINIICTSPAKSIDDDANMEINSYCTTDSDNMTINKNDNLELENENEDAINECIERDKSLDNLFEKVKLINSNVSDPDVLVVSPTQVMKKSFLDHDGHVSTPNLNLNTQFVNDKPFENIRNFEDENLFVNSGNNFVSSSLNSLPLSDLIQKIEVLEDNNKTLFNKIYDVEVKSASNDQYSRRNNFEIAGIPGTINQDNLESTVVNILDKLDIKVGWHDIQACHRLKNNARSNGPDKTIQASN